MIDTSIPLELVNSMSKNTMLEVLDIKVIELGEDFLIGTMPVDHRTHQPMGLLHGGASAVLIESLGSIGSSMLVDLKQSNVVGIEINANHIRGVKKGVVTGKAKLVHGGKRTHLWQVDITDEENKLVCTGKLTVMVVQKS